MRMRQLGKGQSVMFFAPGEVDRRIRDLIPRGQESENGVCVIDILRWAMRETCWDIAHNLPHWAQQGADHHRRFSAYKMYFTGRVRVVRNSWLQPELKTLEEMYEPVLKTRRSTGGLSPGISDPASTRTAGTPWSNLVYRRGNDRRAGARGEPRGRPRTSYAR